MCYRLTSSTRLICFEINRVHSFDLTRHTSVGHDGWRAIHMVMASDEWQCLGTYKMLSKIKTNCVYIHWMEMMCVEVAPVYFMLVVEQRQELKCSRKWENAIKRCRKSCSLKIRFIIYIFTICICVCAFFSLSKSLSCVQVRTRVWAHSFLIPLVLIFLSLFSLTHSLIRSACIHVDVSNIQSHANGFNLHTKWKCSFCS